MYQEWTEYGIRGTVPGNYPTPQRKKKKGNHDISVNAICRKIIGTELRFWWLRKQFVNWLHSSISSLIITILPYLLPFSFFLFIFLPLPSLSFDCNMFWKSRKRNRQYKQLTFHIQAETYSDCVKHPRQLHLIHASMKESQPV